ncbi:non-canonical purine NTP pyrophosphatase [Cordyceps militaris]|uniref:Inosine triphosphate pyrophosphatase n=1 Tax=Cordyceps militaris TaxID=73501 RepID=A0A2H4SUC9_CORMI|nr:non-canonical purine NTP pyrophosphatase [Cordyceps militaris]
MAPHVHFITGNSNKLREVKAILEPEIEVRSLPIDLEEVQGSMEEVTRTKCQRAADIVDGPVLVEDTALCFNALGGLPGVYIKWFLSAIGLEGLNNLLAAYSDKSADAVCTFGYSEGRGTTPILFQGQNCACTRLDTVRFVAKVAFGIRYIDKELGWDPIFEHDDKTFAEMEPEDKNKISHRARALGKLQEYFKEHVAGA